MKTTLLPARQLSADQIAAWADLQSNDRCLDSPFFRPEFTLAVAAVRDDVEVALLEQDSTPVGFFPFQRGRGSVGRPVGGRLSDFHGLVLRPECAVDVNQLMRNCRLAAWHFDHLPATQTAFQSCHWRQEQSPYIDTSQGFEAYQANRRTAGSDAITQTLRKNRKLQREMGTLRFEPASRDERVLETLIRWKGEQYQQSNIVDLFSFGWTEQLLRRILDHSESAFSGMMSALYLNDELVAVHYGIRSNGVLHSWFPAYRSDLRKYSPGSQLLVEIIKAANAMGIERIDLGKGPEPYKQSFMTGAMPLAEGSVDLRATTRTFRRLWHRTHYWVRESPLRGPATVPWRWLRRVRDQLQFR
jgi:CelD/BcsL family acetyltransferase involved in cellulose biosynthesis